MRRDLRYVSLSSFLYFYPLNMHLEEISHLLENHCNHSVCLKVDLYFLLSYFIFSSDMLKQLAVALCNQQDDSI